MDLAISATAIITAPLTVTTLFAAGDGGDGILQPSTASLSAAVSIQKLGER